jgi:methionyl-tRNA formyltransferase
MEESVVFFGSGPVAAKSLELLAKNFAVEAIITKPATAQEMSATLTESVPVYAVSNKSELDELITKQSFNSRLAILIDFGIIVSRTVIDAFPLGIVNSHFSVLPEWRGADPISFAILSGQKTTGVSLMLLDEGMDTGKILVTKSLPINLDDTTPTLTDKLILLSNSLVTEFIPKYVVQEVKPRSQSHPERATYSRKLSKDDGLIDWTKPAAVIEREVRAYIEWPKSRATIAGKEVIVLSAHVLAESGKPGSIGVRGKELIVFCGENALVIDELKPAGKNKMTSEAFLAGHKHLLN